MIVSSTKSGAMRSFFDTVISHRSGWIVRDRNRLIRRWGNMFYYHLLVSGCLHFLKSIVYGYYLSPDCGFNHYLIFLLKYDRILTTNIFFGSIKNRCFLYQGYKNPRPLDKRQQSANIDVSGNVCNEIWKNTHYSKKMDQLLFFQHPSP